MEIITADPDTVKSYWLPMREVRVMPLGDIQLGAETDIARLKSYLKWGKAHDIKFLGMGDYIDVMSPGNRKIFGSVRGALYDSARKAMDNQVETLVDEVCDILKPSKGQWLGLLRGHHYWEFEDGSESDQRIAQYLGCPLLGDCAVVILRLPPPKGSHAAPVEAKIWAHHGPLSSSAQLETSPLTRLEHVTKKFFANVYIVGHYTKKGCTVMPWIDYRTTEDGKIRTVGTNRYLVASGGFMRAYEQGSTNAMGRPAGGYPEKMMLGPTALGAPLIQLRHAISRGYSRVDVNVQV